MKEKIIEIVLSACALKEEADERTELKNLSLDSLSFVSVIVKLEDAFGIEFELEELNIDEWKNVGDLIKAVEEKVCGQE